MMGIGGGLGRGEVERSLLLLLFDLRWKMLAFLGL
jgi:hypothetical protein